MEQDLEKIVRAVVEAMAEKKSCGCSSPAPKFFETSFHSDLARKIDHTVLKPEAVESDIRQACEEAKRFGFASVCIHPCWVPLARQLLAGTAVRVCTVVGFPLGASTSWVKAQEARDAVASGADELDMVLNIGALKSGQDALVQKDIQAVRDACPGKTLKVILETCLLTREEKLRACKLAEQAGADFVKTSTGFSKAGATVEDVRLMRQAVSLKVKVKAAGGIRDRAFAEELVRAGADRIGSSTAAGWLEGVKTPGTGPASPVSY